MSGGHIVEGGVALGFIRVPVKTLPVISQNLTESIGCRQRHPDSKMALPIGCFGVDEIVLVAKVHGGSLCWPYEQREYTGIAGASISGSIRGPLHLRDRPSPGYAA